MWLAMVSLMVAVQPNLDTSPRTAATLGPVDLNGDGVRETLQQTDAGVVVGRATVPCGETTFPCQLEVHDITGSDKAKELVACELGPRDDRTCSVFRMRGDALVELKLTLDPTRRGPHGPEVFYPDQIETKGNGILLARQTQRLYTRIEKFVEKDGTLVHFPQPFYDMGGVTVRIHRSAPITREPKGSGVVANLLPDADVVLLLEHGDHAEHFLVRTSTGLVGWISLEQLMAASNFVQQVYGAG